MITAKINKNGQVSIPAQYRKQFGMRAHQELEVISTAEGVLYKKPLINSWDEVENMIPKQKEYSEKELQDAARQAYASN